MERTILEKHGRVHIPKGIREKLKLRSGEEISLETKGDQIILKPLKSLSEFSAELRGCVKSSKINPLELKKIWSA